MPYDDREPTDPGQPVTQGQCSANVRRVLEQGRRTERSLEHITGKLDAQAAVQVAQGLQLAELHKGLAVHQAEHNGVEKGKARVVGQQAARQSTEVVGLRKLGLLITIGTLVVGLTVWLVTRTMQPSVDELAAAVAGRIDDRGPAGPPGGTGP